MTLNAPRLFYFVLLPFLVIGGAVWILVDFVKSCPECRAIIVELARGKLPTYGNEKRHVEAPPITPTPPPPPVQDKEPVIVPPAPVPATRPATTALPPKSPPSAFDASRQKGRNVGYIEYGRHYNDHESAIIALKRAGISVSSDAGAVFKSLIISPIDFDARVMAVSITPRELGFKSRAPLEHIVKKAEKENLREFPIQAAPSFAIALPSGPNRYYFGMQTSNDANPWDEILAISRFEQTTYLWVMDDNSPDPRPNGLEPDDLIILAR